MDTFSNADPNGRALEQTISHYRVVNLLAQAAWAGCIEPMTTVWTGHASRYSCDLMKVRTRAPIDRRGQNQSSLSHPTSARLDVGEDSGTCLAMELIEGKPLRDVIAAAGFALDRLPVWCANRERLGVRARARIVTAISRART